MPKIKVGSIALAAIVFATAAHAVSLREIIRDCGTDGKKYCKGVSYGAPMQACLSKQKDKLSPKCRAIVERLEKGEKVRLLG